MAEPQRHLVYNCRTGELHECETLEEAHALAAEHDAESHELDPATYAKPSTDR